MTLTCCTPLFSAQIKNLDRVIRTEESCTWYFCEAVQPYFVFKFREYKSTYSIILQDILFGNVILFGYQTTFLGQTGNHVFLKRDIIVGGINLDLFGRIVEATEKLKYPVEATAAFFEWASSGLAKQITSAYISTNLLLSIDVDIWLVVKARF